MKPSEYLFIEDMINQKIKKEKNYFLRRTIFFGIVTLCIVYIKTGFTPYVNVSFTLHTINLVFEFFIILGSVLTLIAVTFYCFTVSKSLDKKLDKLNEMYFAKIEFEEAIKKLDMLKNNDN